MYLGAVSRPRDATNAAVAMDRASLTSLSLTASGEPIGLGVSAPTPASSTCSPFSRSERLRLPSGAPGRVSGSGAGCRVVACLPVLVTAADLDDSACCDCDLASRGACGSLSSSGGHKTARDDDVSKGGVGGAAVVSSEGVGILPNVWGFVLTDDYSDITRLQIYGQERKLR